AFAFLYRTDVGGGLTEHEYDHVFVGRYDADPQPDPAEADAWRWVTPAALRAEMAADPDAFTTWFAMFYEDLLAHAATV
ncbi:MAG TPA: NUDIX domain-containing protein, partial [Longimicrobiaceae bacterium]|nr:NUDIX domain-containing protein [Longimicrobiaceae bacterium]